MQDAPDINVFVPFQVEDNEWKPLQSVAAQSGKIEVMPPSWRTRCWIICDLLERFFQHINEAERDVLTGFCQIVVYRLFDIIPRKLTRDNRF